MMPTEMALITDRLPFAFGWTDGRLTVSGYLALHATLHATNSQPVKGNLKL